MQRSINSTLDVHIIVSVVVIVDLAVNKFAWVIQTISVVAVFVLLLLM